MESTTISSRYLPMLFSSILMQFFIKFHGHLRFICQSKKGVAAHVEIEGFSAYRAGYTWKMASNPHTYVAVLRIVVYEAAHKVFSIIEWANLQFLVQDGPRVERE